MPCSTGATPTYPDNSQDLLVRPNVCLCGFRCAPIRLALFQLSKLTSSAEGTETLLPICLHMYLLPQETSMAKWLIAVALHMAFNPDVHVRRLSKFCIYECSNQNAIQQCSNHWFCRILSCMGSHKHAAGFFAGGQCNPRHNHVMHQHERHAAPLQC